MLCIGGHYTCHNHTMHKGCVEYCSILILIYEYTQDPIYWGGGSFGVNWRKKRGPTHPPEMHFLGQNRDPPTPQKTGTGLLRYAGGGAGRGGSYLDTRQYL